MDTQCTPLQSFVGLRTRLAVLVDTIGDAAMLSTPEKPSLEQSKAKQSMNMASSFGINSCKLSSLRGD
jgi:hypothetical protein